MTFQPTRPLRGATLSLPRFAGLRKDFNPRAPCGARRCRTCTRRYPAPFQPTRPLRGATYCSYLLYSFLQFQPTRPLRGATVANSTPYSSGSISTHAPLAGRDHCPNSFATIIEISTHAPLAGRDPVLIVQIFAVCIFQPTRPLRGATAIRTICKADEPFQPTRPLRGATRSKSFLQLRFKNFNPRAPCGARPVLHKGCKTRENFNPRAPCGARHFWSATFSCLFLFQPTRPLRGATGT